MAIYKEDILDIDLTGGTVTRSMMNHEIGEGDELANRFGVRCFRSGTPASLSGGIVTGYFIRPDGTTVVIGVTISGNSAYVTLPDNCYVYEGTFRLSIKLTLGGATVTARVVEGTIINTTTGSIVDPGGVVPDISELMAVIDRAEAAAEAIADFSVYTELISGTDYALVVSTGEV